MGHLECDRKLEALEGPVESEQVPKARHCRFFKELLCAEVDSMHQIHSSNSKQSFALEETVLT
jgi:hypothetical protein